MKSQWPLPENDYWSTPFAEALLSHLDIFPGATVLDVAAGSGIPAFHIAEQVGSEGRVLADRSLLCLLKEDWSRILDELEERFGPSDT